MKPFGRYAKSRHKKMPIPVRKDMKIVQIDSRTSIEVSIGISDEDARNNWLFKHSVPLKPKHIKVDPVMPQEHAEDVAEEEIEELVEATEDHDDDLFLPELDDEKKGY